LRWWKINADQVITEARNFQRLVCLPAKAAFQQAAGGRYLLPEPETLGIEQKFFDQ